MKRSLSVVIVNTNPDKGGAARAALRLNAALLQAGARSRVLAKIKGSPQVSGPAGPSGIERQDARITERLQALKVNRNRTALSDTLFSLDYPGTDVTSHDLVEGADIVNLHWVARFLSAESVARLLQMGKRVVWTLHDMRPFTGGCHYSAGCLGYEQDCSECPQLESDPYDISHTDLANKIDLWDSRITVVTPSRWLARKARKSRVFKNCRIETIPNAVETEIFVNSDKRAAKRRFSISEDSVTLLFGAENHGEQRKGFSVALKMFSSLKDGESSLENAEGRGLQILTFGKPDPSLEQTGIPCTSLGYVNDDAALADAYAAADLFLLPSREDNLPNTMLEAMSCGTPVVAFHTGGMPEMIKPGQTGELAEPFDPEDLAVKVAALAADDETRRQMSEACRSLVENGYTLAHQGERYIELFEDLLSKPPASKTKDTKLPDTEENLLPMTSNLFPAYRALVLETISGMGHREATLESHLKEKVLELQEARGKIEEISTSWSYRIGWNIVRPVVFLLKLLGVGRKERLP